jgi:hypothetical protein
LADAREWWPDSGLGWAGGSAFLAQVGEWLKPTDCKSVPPSEVRRFESFPVHQLRVNRLVLAFAAYVALGILSWMTLSDQRVRLAVSAILAMFAFRTWVRRNDVLHRDKHGEE